MCCAYLTSLSQLQFRKLCTCIVSHYTHNVQYFYVETFSDTTYSISTTRYLVIYGPDHLCLLWKIAACYFLVFIFDSMGSEKTLNIWIHITLQFHYTTTYQLGKYKPSVSNFGPHFKKLVGTSSHLQGVVKGTGDGLSHYQPNATFLDSKKQYYYPKIDLHILFQVDSIAMRWRDIASIRVLCTMIHIQADMIPTSGVGRNFSTFVTSISCEVCYLTYQSIFLQNYITLQQFLTFEM